MGVSGGMEGEPTTATCYDKTSGLDLNVCGGRPGTIKVESEK